MEISASLSSPYPFHALIVAAGGGSRMGDGLPKQYRKLGDKTVLRRTIDIFLSCPGIEGLQVVIAPEHADLYAQSVQGLGLPAPAFGGMTRSESVANGLARIPQAAKNILIHDAARPFVDHAAILSVAGALRDHNAVTLAVPATDTLQRDDGTYVDRAGLWALQTPQGFAADLIRRAHALSRQGATDDTALAAALGETIKIIPGSRRNFKITTAEDWDMAIALTGTGLPRTGMGFDVHAFDPDKPGPVRLCGIDVPHEFALKGHSDADVGLHALTDALLGAIAAGDIGQHFPPSDPQWQGVDSAVFLQHAVAMVRDAGAVISNLDLTLICEAPKVGPWRPAMQARIAELCGLQPGQIGIKATTTERLGFTGRGEGIAAQAVATILTCR